MAQTTGPASFGPVLVVSTLPVTFHPPTCPYFVLPQAHVMPCNSCWCHMMVVEVAVVVMVFGSAVMVTMSQW